MLNIKRAKDGGGNDRPAGGEQGGGRRGLTGGRLQEAPAVGDSRQWEETTNAGRKRAKQRRQEAIRAGGQSGQAATAVQSTTTERRPRVKVPTTGEIRTTEDDGRPMSLLAPDGEMDHGERK
ncbi:hypothetical protein Scep_010579 [Stephania cephalantha]|uniref:Uncharacterized protein n=1 Tax=Stephania cephalantha TaxID=152367 RepID=A0AAP0JWM2_9MAGN